MERTGKAIALLALGVIAAPARLQAVSFTPLGDLPGGNFQSVALAVSPDGSTVTGYGTIEFSNNPEAFRWTAATGMTGLGFLPGGAVSYGTAASQFGTYIVGYGGQGGSLPDQAFRWSAPTGIVGLGSLAHPGDPSFAFDISASGEVVVGRSSSASGDNAFWWTDVDGMKEIPAPVGGGFRVATATAVSHDGSTIVGEGFSAAGQEAFIWTSGGGTVRLGDLAGGILKSEASDVSADGKVVVGYAHSDTGMEAFRWTESDGMVGLGALPGAVADTWALGVSADGNTIVGKSNSAFGWEAFLWTSNGGMQAVREALIAQGVIGLDGWRLHSATGISADGLTIVGSGTNPQGHLEAWMARLGAEVQPVPLPATVWLLFWGLAGLGVLSSARKQ